MYFSIGLDKKKQISYIKLMVKIKLVQEVKAQKKDLIEFAKNQFRFLLKRNLSIPVKLFQL